MFEIVFMSLTVDWEIMVHIFLILLFIWSSQYIFLWTLTLNPSMHSAVLSPPSTISSRRVSSTKVSLLMNSRLY